MAMRASAEEMLMMRPPSRNRGRARWMMKNGARVEDDQPVEFLGRRLFDRAGPQGAHRRC
jgi:hypothetical protein